MNQIEKAIFDDLLSFVVKFAEQNESVDLEVCWNTIERARNFLANGIVETKDIQESLLELKANGLTLKDALKAYQVSAEDAYAIRARKLVHGGNDVIIDDVTCVSKVENGALVLGWVYVSNDDVGGLSHSSMLEETYGFAREAIKLIESDGSETSSVVGEWKIQAEWLHDLITTYWYELDTIEAEVTSNPPGPTIWVDEAEVQHEFMAADALTNMLVLARKGGLPDCINDQVEAFISQYGNRLESILTEDQC